MPRRPPKDPVLALAYQLAVEAAERDFKAAHPHLKEFFRDDDKKARRRQELNAEIGRRRDERRRRDRK
jgi:hypothetical protein